jgi:type I restriction enzyme M protein
MPANHPFKGSIDKSDINNSPPAQDNKDGMLFIEWMMHCSRPGENAVLLSQWGFCSAARTPIKTSGRYYSGDGQIDAIGSIPSGVFKPYAGVSTAVLIFTKGGNTDRVWFYDMEADGYSLDDKRTPLNRKGDIPDIIERFRKRREENPTNRKGKCFFVPIREITENGYDLSISRYKKIEYEEIRYEKPDVIIQKIEALESDIQTGLSELR